MVYPTSVKAYGIAGSAQSLENCKNSGNITVKERSLRTRMMDITQMFMQPVLQEVIQLLRIVAIPVRSLLPVHR